MYLHAVRSALELTSPCAREIDRDERIVLLTLRPRLLELVDGCLAAGHGRDLPDTLAALETELRAARDDARRLNDARIDRRGDRPQAEAPAELPAELQVHACHGVYVGAFPDHVSVGRMAVAALGVRPAPRTAAGLRDLALDLHRRGVLWTLDHRGQVHVWRVRERAHAG